MARITLSPNRTLEMNAHAYRSFGEPRAVELLLDGNRNLIGLKPCDPHKKNAFEFKRRVKDSRARISIGAFLTHFKIKPERTVLFEEIDLDADGTIILDMKKTTGVSRGSR